jgi:hypothetical protein
MPTNSHKSARLHTQANEKTNKAIEFNKLIQSNINTAVQFSKKEFSKNIVKPKFLN